MSYQFIHVECYAREGSKQGKGKWSIRDIVAEAGREEGNYYHVENAKEPTLVYGVSLAELEKKANEWGDQAKDARGHKLRKDGHCLLAGVISLPREQEKDWEKFKAKSIEWLKDQYGERLKTVVEHTDETHPHIHFYAVPNAGERFEVLHKGQQAANLAKKAGKKKGEQNKDYCEAMRCWQDNFGGMASKFGLARLGPGRRRLTRAQWKAEQAQARALVTVKDQAKAVAKKYVAHFKKKGAEKWLGTSLLDKFKFSWLNVPSQKMKQKAEKAQADKAEAEERAARLQKEKNKAEATAERRLEEGKEHAKASRLAIDKAKKYKAKALELKDENEALRAEVADLKAPKPAHTTRYTKRQGLALS